MACFVCKKDQPHEPALAVHRVDRERWTVLILDQQEQLARLDLLLDRDIETRFAFSIDIYAIDYRFAECPFADAVLGNFGNGDSDRTRKQWLVRVDAQGRQRQIRRPEVEREPRDAEALVARFDCDRNRL